LPRAFEMRRELRAEEAREAAAANESRSYQPNEHAEGVD